MRARRHSRSATGFTLVEVLVALVIMAIMAGIAWQGVDGIVRARDASQQRLEQTLRLNTVIGQWDQDLASLQKSTAVPDAIAFDGSTLRLTRRAPGGLQVVAWSLRPDANGANWLRWAGPVVTTVSELQDSWLRSQQLMDNDPRQLRTIAGISGWQVQFFIGTAWANAQSSRGETEFPKGVRVILTFAPGAGTSGTLTRDTLINQ